MGARWHARSLWVHFEWWDRGKKALKNIQGNGRLDKGFRCTVPPFRVLKLAVGSKITFSCVRIIRADPCNLSLRIVQEFAL